MPKASRASRTQKEELRKGRVVADQDLPRPKINK